MKRSGERCSCGRLVPYLMCSHCKPQVGECPTCGERFIMAYGDAASAGEELLRKFKERSK